MDLVSGYYFGSCTNSRDRAAVLLGREFYGSLD